MRCTLFFLLISLRLWAQPFADDIRHFRHLDSLSPPPQGAILFLGSSSFTLWKDVAASFPKHSIINRGFGGSTLLDQCRYLDDLVRPYQPKQIVIYCGENDLAADSTATADTLLSRFRTFYTGLKNLVPNAHIVYVSMKPSPSRIHLIDKMKAGNRLIKKMLKKEKNTAFIDVFSAMINEDGLPDVSFFSNDLLHMNKKGYDLWREMIGYELISE